ncbi:NAD(P)-dependent oxidoreductase [Christensenellaceae bacterium OttesenSCG-928-M15]|nr:NAD(P)-dependent oxidoreductase [Christensenellaceae bacterium OttesenSCG-928-M15]
MKHAIVTGATGFVGRNLVKELAQNGVAVSAVVREISEKTKFLEALPAVVPVVCTLEDMPQLPRMLGRVESDTVFCHLAWQGTAGDARVDYGLQLRNVLYTIDALKAAQAMGCEGFVGAGSLMEYESTAAVHHESEPPSQANIYSTAKLTAHYMSRIAAANMDIRYVWPYITNAYGEEEVSPRFLNTTVRKLLAGEQLAFSAATQQYDFIHVSDVAKAFYLACEHGVNGRTYCVGSGESRPLKEYIREARDIIDPSVELAFGEKPGICLDEQYFDTTLIAADTGFRPNISFTEGILRLQKEWRKAHEN